MKKRFAFLVFLGLVFLALLPDALAAASPELPAAVNVRDADMLLRMLQEGRAEMSKDPANIGAAKKAGVAAHQLALFKGKGYAEQAIEALSLVVAKEPDDPVFMAYLGSSYALLGREEGAVMQKINNVNRGLSLLNKAVRKAPDDFIVRMVRGSVTYELPDMFKQRETAFEDFSFVESCFGKVQGVDAELMAEVYYKLGCLVRDKGDSAAQSVFFFKAVEASPDSQWAQRAKKE